MVNRGLFQKGHLGYKSMLGRIHSEETKKRMSDAKKGKKHTGEHKRKIGIGNTGKKHPHTKETKKKIGKAHKGKRLTEEHKRKISEAVKKNHSRYWLGKKQSKETIQKRVEKISGENHYKWKGGISPINVKIRNSLEYKLWREAVFKRDNYMCIWCGQKGGKLNADHIKRFSDYPELRFAIDNGRTLCISCHKKTDTYGNKK